VHPALTARWRAPGRHPTISEVDAFLMLLIYLRSYPDFASLAAAFEMTKSAAQNTLNRVLSAVRDPLLERFVKQTRKPEQLLSGIVLI